MELNEIELGKTLHLIVDQFISSVKMYFEQTRLDSSQVFHEILKRSHSITHDMRLIALCFMKQSGNIDAFEMASHLNTRVQELVHNLLQQDFVELMFTAHDENFNITEKQLHNFLLSGAMLDAAELSPFQLNFNLAFSFDPTIFGPSEAANVRNDDRVLNSFLPSSRFEISHLEFEDELDDLRRIMETGFSSSDLSKFNVASLSKYESSDAVGRKTLQKTQPNWLNDGPNDSFFRHSSVEEFPLSDFESDLCFKSWESSLGMFLPEHHFISEETPDAILNSISEQESQAFCSLLNTSDVICEKNMVHDILDLLIGVPSDAFCYDIHSRRFIIKPGVHLPNLSPECTAAVMQKFMESGSICYLLHKLSIQVLNQDGGNVSGLVYKGFQFGIQQVLSVYKEYIAAVKMSSPSLLSLRQNVAPNAEIFRCFGLICGVDVERMEIRDLPKGLGLLSYLQSVAQSHQNRESSILIAVLLKCTYAPYFNFLNKWMTEGKCDDPYEEFQIMEDSNYLKRRDALYWKFAYTEIIDDPTRAVPSQISSYSQGILDCGKGINLMKICCPNLFSLKYLLYKPPPPLSMDFSFAAIFSKLEENLNYVALKDQYELHGMNHTEVSIDSFLTECQKFVDKENMMDLVLRKWKILCASAHTKSNMCSSSQAKQHFKEEDCTSIPKKAMTLYSKCRSLSSLSIMQYATDFNFSGQVLNNVGLVFSSCGYHAKDCRHDYENDLIDIKTPSFHRQLELISYSGVSTNFFESLSRYKKFFSAQEIDFLNIVQDKSIPLKEGNGNCLPNNQRKSLCNVPIDQMCSETAKRKAKSLGGSGFNCGGDAARPFIEKLATLLLSEYGDTVDDVLTCIQVMSLHQVMMHNLNAILKLRIHLIERTTVEYIMNQLRLDSLLSNLRNLYFLQDENFSQSFCEQLFPMVLRCHTPGAFANWTVLNELLQRAISDCGKENDPFFSLVNINLTCIPEDKPFERTKLLKVLVLEYEVGWPLNIIIHDTCMQQYSKIFSILLEIEFLCWMLSFLWRTLIVTSKELHLDDAPQFRKIMLHRFEMEQFVRVIHSSIHHHLQGPLWDFLSKSMSIEEASIDGLERMHMEYLEKALARCFLTHETHALHELLTVMFCQIFKFSSTVLECRWKLNGETGCYELFEYKRLLSYFDAFKEYQKVFLKIILKEMLTKKFGRHWDKDYKEFLETILDTEKNLP